MVPLAPLACNLLPVRAEGPEQPEAASLLLSGPEASVGLAVAGKARAAKEGDEGGAGRVQEFIIQIGFILAGRGRSIRILVILAGRGRSIGILVILLIDSCCSCNLRRDFLV